MGQGGDLDLRMSFAITSTLRMHCNLYITDMPHPAVAVRDACCVRLMPLHCVHAYAPTSHQL